jgi:hypothetical protein
MLNVRAYYDLNKQSLSMKRRELQKQSSGYFRYLQAAKGKDITFFPLRLAINSKASVR